MVKNIFFLKTTQFYSILMLINNIFNMPSAEIGNSSWNRSALPCAEIDSNADLSNTTQTDTSFFVRLIFMAQTQILVLCLS